MFEPTGTLADIIPEARPKFAELLEIAEELGLEPSIRSAGRTCADQQALYEKGSSTTKAALCRSWHVLGRAIDVDISPNTCDAYTKLGEIWEDMGGIWGGRFSGFGECGDRGHFELAESAAVPESICPSGISLEECEDIRDAYLGQAFRSQGGALFALFGVLVGAGIGFAFTRKF